jgi:predicted membrane channel-forming protein YqfA (hemolysin III family)
LKKKKKKTLSELAGTAQRRGASSSFLSLLSNMPFPEEAGRKTGEEVRAAPSPPPASVAATPRRRRSNPPSLLAALHPASPFWELAPDPAHHPLASMPPALRFNPFIAHGFRPAGAHPWVCLCSWASFHNESVNVWTHLGPLLGGALALACGLEAAQPWPRAPLAWLLTAGPAALCLAGSVAYHTLMPAHARYGTWLALDLAGVFLLFVAGMAPLLWWGFACHPTVRGLFLSSYYGGAAAAVVASLRATSPAARAAPMAGLAGVRFASLGARALLGAGARAALPHYVAMEALSVAGALINVARWPERWLDGPRRARAAARAKEGGGRSGGGRGGGVVGAAAVTPHLVDFAFNSHNLMHLAVLGALVAYGRGAAAEYAHYHHGRGAACGG